MGLHKARPVISQLRIREGLKGSYFSLLSYWLLIAAGRVGASLSSVEYPQVNPAGSGRHFQTSGHADGSG